MKLIAVHEVFAAAQRLLLAGEPDCAGGLMPASSDRLLTMRQTWRDWRRRGCSGTSLQH